MSTECSDKLCAGKNLVFVLLATYVASICIRNKSYDRHFLFHDIANNKVTLYLKSIINATEHLHLHSVYGIAKQAE